MRRDGADVYLVGLRLTGRAVVVVGGGRVLARRLETLLRSGADVVVVAPALHPVVARAAQEGRIRWEPRPYAPGDLAEAWYAMASTDSPEVNAAVVAEAETRRIFCVRADDGSAGQAVTPATGRRGEVQVGVLTGGDYRASRRLRDEFVKQLTRDGYS